jgi:hypothetical protein
MKRAATGPRPAPRPRAPRAGGAQAWVVLATLDPEATSALAVGRTHLAAGKGLRRITRMRVYELEGMLPERTALEALLHRSTQFYNPHKERCVVRASARDPAPVPDGAHVVLVSERGGERREAAERWWTHETGKRVEVREAVAWVLEFEPGVPADEHTRELAVLRDRRHGLLCNPHSQDHRIAAADIPLPWMTAPVPRPARKRPS